MRKRPLIGAVVTALTLSASLATSQVASAQDADDPPPPDDVFGPWTACSDFEGIVDPVQYQCSTVTVPLDHAEPDGETIELGAIRRLADSPSQRQGTIFVNPGGPSGSGVGLVAFAGDTLFDEEVNAQFDIIGFDPRGVQFSTPLNCFPDDPEAVFDLFPSFPWPEASEEFTEQRMANRELRQACQAEAGPIIDHMSTAQVARDMDLMREGVGDEQLNFVGYSYGSYVGNMYANLFPDNVGAVILDGVLDPVDWATGTDGVDGKEVPLSARLDSDVGANDTLDEFFRLCDDAGPDGCAFAPDSEQRYAALFERLDSDPIVTLDPITLDVITLDDRFLVSNTLGPLYSSQAFGFLANFLADFEQALEELDDARDPDAELDPAFLRRLADLRRDLPDTNAGFGFESFLGVACTDGLQPDRISAWRQAARDSDGYFGPLWALNDVWCSNWPAFDPGRYLGPFDKQTANTVLVASTEFDPATAYSGALAVKEQLPNSALLTVEGWGHTTPGLSACADAISNDYLLTRTVPEETMVCEQDFEPFDLPAGAEAAGQDEAGEAPRVPGAPVPDAVDDAMNRAAEAARDAGDDELADRLERRAKLLEHVRGPRGSR